MSAARQPVDRTFRPGESVPHTGIYTYVHAHACGTAADVVLLVGEVFPSCRKCGAEGSFHLLRAVPHISDDADFYE